MKHAPIMEKADNGVRAMQAIMRRFGHNPFALEQFLREAPSDISPAEWHCELLRLCRQHTVHMMRKSWGERLYQIPIQRYVEQVSAEMISYSSKTGEQEGITYGSYVNLAMTEQVLAVLIEADRQPFYLTKKRSLNKNSMDRLLRTLKVDPSVSEEERSRAVLEPLDLAWRMRLIDQDQAMMKTEVPRMTEWLRQDHLVREEQMFMIWYRVHHPMKPALQWVTAAIRSMKDLRWISYLDIYNMLHDRQMELTAGELERWLVRLHTAGWIELGQDESDISWVRRRLQPDEEQRTLVVQQDFELLALPGTPYEVIYQLHQIADPLSWEGVLRFRLSASSLYRALDRRWDASQAICFLQKHAMDHIPESITSKIEQWEQDRAAVHITQGIVLHVSHERAVKTLESSCDQLQLTRLSEHYWLAEGADERELAGRFDQLGLRVVTSSIEPEQATGHTHESESARQVTGNTLDPEVVCKEALHPQAPGFYKPQDISYLYRADRLSSIEQEMYPDFEQVPAIWYEQYRKYHPSTARHIIEQAIRWKTSVRIRAADEEFSSFIPIAIDETGERCKIHGRCGDKLHILGLHQIDQVKLLAPGLCD